MQRRWRRRQRQAHNKQPGGASSAATAAVYRTMIDRGRPHEPTTLGLFSYLLFSDASWCVCIAERIGTGRVASVVLGTLLVSSLQPWCSITTTHNIRHHHSPDMITACTKTVISYREKAISFLFLLFSQLNFFLFLFRRWLGNLEIRYVCCFTVFLEMLCWSDSLSKNS